MEALKVNINERDIWLQDTRDVLQHLMNDDEFLIDYIYRAAQAGRLIKYGIIPSHAATGNLTIRKYEIVDQDFVAPPAPDEEATTSKQFYPFDSVSDNDLLYHELSNQEDTPNQKNTNDENTQPSSKILVWQSKKRASSSDKEATKLLIELRGSEQFKKKFADKKHNKLHVWKEIAKILHDKGYVVGEDSTAGEKCRQKFSNLQKSYINFVANQKQTGAGYLDPPEYFEELNVVLGEKHKVNPQYLVSSMDVETSIDISTTVSPARPQPRQEVITAGPSSAPHDKTSNRNELSSSQHSEPGMEKAGNLNISTKNKFKNKITKPKTNAEKILKSLENMVESGEKRTQEILQKHEDQNKMLAKYLEKHEKNEKAFLKLFASLVKNSQHRKRKQSSSESDEDND